jgi:hypothetical protein
MRAIRVDFNRRDGEGRVLTSVARAQGNVGDLVLIYQAGEPEQYYGSIDQIDGNGRVRIAIDWSRPAPSQPWSVRTVSGGAIAAQWGPVVETGPVLAGSPA